MNARGNVLRDRIVALAQGGLDQESRRAAARKLTRDEDGAVRRSEEHTSELQSRSDLVCRLLLEKKKKSQHNRSMSPSTCATPPAPRTGARCGTADCPVGSTTTVRRRPPRARAGTGTARARPARC